MTQQPYYPQQFQQPPAQPQYPTYPQQPQVPQQYAPPAPAQQMPQAPFPTQQPPAQPLAQGTIDDYYNQPSTGGGPSLSWSNKDGSQKPVGTVYAGIVARDVTHADIQQETDFRTQQPKFYRDGRPKFVMKVPLKVQPSPDYPDGEAAWYVKGQARDELVRAMAEAGCEGAPKGGAGIVIELVQRKPMGQGMNPANIVRVQYQPPAGQGGQIAPPVQQQPQGQPVQSAAPGTEASSPAPVPTSRPSAAPVQQHQQAPASQYQQQPQAPAPQHPIDVPTPTPPADLSPEQQQLLAQLTGRQA